MADYAYLFPDMGNLHGANPIPPPRTYSPNTSWQPSTNTYQQNLYTPYNAGSSQTLPSQPMTPNTLFGQTPSQSYNMPMGDFSGFGLTVPASYFPGQQPNQMSNTYNMPGSRQQQQPTQTTYQTYPQPTSVVTTTTTTVPPNPPNGAAPDAAEVERQKRLRTAVRNLTSSAGEGTMDDPEMSLEQVERQHRITEDIREKIHKEADTDNNRTEAMQVSDDLACPV
jgi:hypothetical protein